jgi:SagB-type dehydrogenase family enzyme
MPSRALKRLPTTGGEEACWELFHENSKLGRIARRHRPAIEPAADQASLRAAFTGCPTFELATPQASEFSLDAAIGAPRPTGLMRPGRIWRDTLAALLLSSFTKSGEDDVVSLAVELWFHATSIDGMPAGLYRMDPKDGRVMLVRGGDLSDRIGAALVEPELASRSALQFFVVADLARLAAEHGERGYRYALVESGRIARGLDLVAAALGLVVIANGEFRDREIDLLLGLDGLATAALLLIAVGKTGKRSEERGPIGLGGPQRGRRRRRRGRR